MGMSRPGERPRVELVLYELCTQLGFCLSGEATKAIISNPPKDPDAFTEAVIVADGLDPETVDRHLRRQVRACIVEHMLWRGSE